MASWDAIAKSHVLAALAEYDEIGQAEFLARYGFGEATGYRLVLGDRWYDSKAIVGVAHRYATGRALTAQEFSGGKEGAAGVLRRLGFRVDGPDDNLDGPKGTRSGTYRESDGSAVPFPEAQSLWVLAARQHLLATAAAYHAVTTYKELSEQVQAATGVRTRMLMMNWIGGVLGLVAEECARRGEPLLSALCVNQEGSVGPGYGPSVKSLRGGTPTDADGHAALERLECYRRFGATIPADGGRPALSPTMRRRLDRATAQQPERRGAVCPTCYVELPVSGACMHCA